MRFLPVMIFSSAFLLIGAGCIQSPAQNFPFEYVVKSADDPCPKGQKMSYAFNGAATVENGCRNIAADAGKVCTSDDDCSNSCFVDLDYLEQLNCVDTARLCAEKQLCEGIRGRCAAIPDEGNIILLEENTVYAFCEE